MDSHVARFVNLVIAQSLADEASDIYFELDARGGYTINQGTGTECKQLTVAPQAMASEIASYLKELSGLDASNTGNPQSGHFTFKGSQASTNLLVNSLPLSQGEAIAVKVL